MIDNEASVTVFVLKIYSEYECRDGRPESVSGGMGEAVITFDVTDNGKYVLNEYTDLITPKDIEGMYPEKLLNILDEKLKNVNAEELKKECYDKAKKHYNTI